MHAALAGLFILKEIVSTGLDLARLDRRNVLKLCAASLSAALGTGLSSCAAAPEKRAQVVFKEVTSAQLETAAGTLPGHCWAC